MRPRAGHRAATCRTSCIPRPARQTQMADWLAPLIGFKNPFNPSAPRSPASPARRRPTRSITREVEDPAFYDVVAQAPWLGQGNVSGQDYMDFTFPGARYKEILPGDVVQMGYWRPGLADPLHGRDLQSQRHDDPVRQSRHRAAARHLGRHGHGLPPQVRVGRHDPELPAAAQRLPLRASLLRAGGRLGLSPALPARAEPARSGHGQPQSDHRRDRRAGRLRRHHGLDHARLLGHGQLAGLRRAAPISRRSTADTSGCSRPSPIGR